MVFSALAAREAEQALAKCRMGVENERFNTAFGQIPQIGIGNDAGI